jgi:tricorn protease
MPRVLRWRPAPAFAVSALATVAILAAFAALASPAAALEECRLLRMPDIEGQTIVFVYAGDLWTVPRAGGVASRLTTHEGREVFPKLSPDGRTVAFTGEYDGNLDAYTIPTEGGEPTRLTWHPAVDQVAEWYPDGKSVLLRSTRASSVLRYQRFFRIAAAGGYEDMLPLPTAGYATLSPTGRQIAYVSPSYDSRTWKHYRGGNAPDIWVYDFDRNTSEKISDWDGPDEWPMWHGHTVYYCSDRGGKTANLWAYDLETKQQRQVTHFTDYDVKWPSIGSDAIVFENGGYLYVMGLPDEQAARIKVLVPDDKPGARAELRNVAKWTTGWELSPSAKRVAIEARGDVFTVPAEKGDVRNLTHSPGSRERGPTWSPDGKWIAYQSDRTGEYEIYVIGADGKSPERQVSRGADTYRWALGWSPDSKKLVFSDKTRTLYWCDVATGKITRVDKSDHGKITDYAWSGDSRWIAYAFPGANQLGRIMLYSLTTGKISPVTNGMTDDFAPVFDPDGRYLYFGSRRTLQPEFGAFELNFQFIATDKIYAATLRADVESPVKPESDEEGGGSGDESKDAKDKAGKDQDAKGGKDSKAGAKAEAPPLVVDLDGLGQRLVEMPIAATRLAGLQAFSDRLIYSTVENPDIEGEGHATGDIHSFDLKKRKDVTVIAGVETHFSASKDGEKVLYHTDDQFGIVKTDDTSKPGDGKVDAGTLMTTVDPRQEWMQMFNEAWRLERDFYYDPNMGGLDWKAIGERYRQLVPYVAHRSDLNYILGELLGELGTSHSYVGGGELPLLPRTNVGLLGADFDLDASSGLYRFKTLYRERDWNSKVAAPLAAPGVAVREGDYLLSVNGVPVHAPENVFAAFVGTQDKQTRITVGSAPNDPKPRTYTVEPIADEATLRYTAWVGANRDRVARATGGKIAYIHVPDTALDGIEEFSKQYYPQVDREGIIVDERFNSGGFIPDFFVERLGRQTMTYWSTRDGADFRTPSSAIDGPKCILINEYAGSGGDAFPYYFRLHKLGPVIGKRTWGGLVGISENIPLVDGGVVTMADFGMWDPASGQWAVENHGVDPDVVVENAPDRMVSGHDPQLERAIEYCMDQLKTNPPKRPARPKYKLWQ